MTAKTITVFSHKGGVGTTFVTVNVATALAVSKRKVLLLDLDFNGGQDMARMLKLSPKGSVAETFKQEDSDDPKKLFTKVVSQHKSGMHFLPVVRNTKDIGLVTPESIKPFLHKAAKVYDFIVIDGGKTFTETLITVFDCSNSILLVATPDVLAVYQMKWCLEVLQSLQFPIKMVKLILNRSESRGSVAWQDVSNALPVEIFNHIPSDGKTVGLALNRGVPVVLDSPRSKVAEAFARIVKGLGNKNFYVAATELDRGKTVDNMEKPGEFWAKFGISQQVGASSAGFVEQEDKIDVLKRKIHERLVERLNLEGITTDVLSDPQAALGVKKKATEVVGTILMEETGGKIDSHEKRVKIINDIVNEALGLGPLEDFLADPDVTDIMVNSKDELYVEKSGKLILTNKKFVSDQKMRAIIDRIIAPLGRRIDESTPMVDARLPDGSRINAIIPPLSLSGPMITIRKFGAERLTSDDLLKKYNSLTKDMSKFLHACVLGRKNIIVSGGTGAGKTTLLNVISEFIPDGERIITIEDAAELRLKKSHWGRLESRPANLEGRGEVTIRDLFINTLRMRPDRIIVGECRGAEVLDMLQAMNTGHDGSMTTLHANSTKDVITRMNSMILLSGIELPVRAINEMISSAVDIIVQINRFSDGTRKITGIAEIDGLTEDWQLKLKDIFVFKQTGISKEGDILGEYKPSGQVPNCFDELVTRGFPIDRDMFDVSS